MNFRYPPAGGGTEALRSYLRVLAAELNEAVALLGERQDRFSADAALSVAADALPSLPAGMTPEDFAEGGFSAIRMGKNVLLAAGNRLFLGSPDGKEEETDLKWTAV